MIYYYQIRVSYKLLLKILSTICNTCLVNSKGGRSMLEVLVGAVASAAVKAAVRKLGK